METFDRHDVSFVSVTQHFNTSNSMGRLMLNVLLSFAQFEREIIGERTRDKMSAARRKGKWIGGIPVLGYDVDAAGGKLVVNPEEATRVLAIFRLYAEHRGLVPVVRELNDRGWTTKAWTTRDGRRRPGRPFTKNALFRLLTNVLYTGNIRHKGEIYPGEQAPILDPTLWQQVQEILGQNGISGGREIGNRYGAILKGILHCASCGTAMLHTWTVRRGRRYRYYVCLTAQQRGWKACATKSVNAHKIEQSILERIRGLVAQPWVAAETCRRADQKRKHGALDVGGQRPCLIETVGGRDAVDCRA
jgi:site-specific DNA recombinase